MTSDGQCAVVGRSALNCRIPACSLVPGNVAAACCQPRGVIPMAARNSLLMCCEEENPHDMAVASMDGPGASSPFFVAARSNCRQDPPGHCPPSSPNPRLAVNALVPPRSALRDV